MKLKYNVQGQFISPFCTQTKDYDGAGTKRQSWGVYSFAQNSNNNNLKLDVKDFVNCKSFFKTLSPFPENIFCQNPLHPI